MDEKSSQSTRRQKGSAGNNQAQAVDPGDLRKEIELLRGLVQKAAALSEEDRSLTEMLDILETVSKAYTRLAGLLKAQRSLEATSDSDFDLQKALVEAARRLREGPPEFRPGGK